MRAAMYALELIRGKATKPALKHVFDQIRTDAHRFRVYVA